MPALQKKHPAGLQVEVIEDDGDWSCLPDAEPILEQSAAAVASVLLPMPCSPLKRSRAGMVTSAAR